MRAQSLSRNHLFRHRRLPTVPKINPVRGENPNHQYPERESEILGNLHPTNSTNKNPLGSPMSAGKIRMTAPLPLLTKRLRENGFWSPSPKVAVSNGIKNLQPLPVKDLILPFRTILSGFVNFYSFADNITSLIHIYYLLSGSLKKTIGRKMDIG